MVTLAAEKVKQLRERKMLTQVELAEMAGVTPVTIQRIERGVGGVRPKTAARSRRPWEYR